MEKILRRVIGAPKAKNEGRQPSAQTQSFKKAGKLLGEALGGSRLTRKLGGVAGARLARLMGHGDYVETNMGDTATVPNPVKVNSLMSGSPQMGTFDNHGSVRIQHREFISDIISGTSNVFTNSSYIVNPGLSSVFPFLAQIASNYEMYRFHGLTFEFVSATSPFGATSLGVWVMAMEYNAAAAAFTAKPQMENSDYAMSSRLDSHGMYGVECKALTSAQVYYYVRSPVNPVGPTGTPVNLVDFGLFQFAQVPGIAAGSNMGELWVTYDVELIRPRLVAPNTADVYSVAYPHFSGDGVPDIAPESEFKTGVLANATFTNTATSMVLTLPTAVKGQVYTIDYTWNSNISGLLGAVDTSTFSYTNASTSTLQLKQQVPASTETISANQVAWAFTQTFVITATAPATVTVTPHPNSLLGFPGIPTVGQGKLSMKAFLLQANGT